MKKIIIAFFILTFLSGYATAFEWQAANQATIAWDAVTKMEDGSDIPATSTVKYQVYTKDESGTITVLQEVDTLQATITFTVEGKYLIGIQTIRYEGAEKVSESTINWSDVNGGSTPDPFGFSFYQKTAQPLGLKTQ